MRRVHAVFDTDSFWDDVNSIRESRGVSWRHMSEETGLKCLYESARSVNPLIDTLVLIAAWAEISLDAYVHVFDRSGDQQRAHFDIARFYSDLDCIRITRNLTWNGVFRAVPSIAIPRLLKMYVDKQIALSPEARQALAAWAGLDVSNYAD